MPFTKLCTRALLSSPDPFCWYAFYQICHAFCFRIRYHVLNTSMARIRWSEFHMLHLKTYTIDQSNKYYTKFILLSMPSQERVLLLCSITYSMCKLGWDPNVRIAEQCVSEERLQPSYVRYSDVLCSWSRLQNEAEVALLKLSIHLLLLARRFV